MKIKIYQIDESIDRYDVSYANYDYTMKTAGQINPNIYKKVYEGNVKCKDLDGIYDLFNSDECPAYEGGLLSVSDVVEVCNKNSSIPKGCYFCDTIGWREVKNFNKFER